MPTKQVTYMPRSRGEADNNLQNQMSPSVFLLHVDEAAYNGLQGGGVHKDDLKGGQFEVLKSTANNDQFYHPTPVELNEVFGTDDEKAITEFMVRHGKLENP